MGGIRVKICYINVKTKKKAFIVAISLSRTILALPQKNTSLHIVLITAVICFAYVLTGKLSLLLAIPPGYASAIFPPAGIAVTAAFIAGRRSIPGVLLGSFLLNVWIGYESTQSISVLGCTAALWIACASVIQACAGGWLLRKIVNYPAAFDNLRDVVAFQLLSPLICLISATLSVSALVILGMVQQSNFMLSWLMWWVGDTLGLLILLPLTMVVAGRPRALWRKRASTVAIPMLFAFSVLVVLYVHVSRWEQAESLVEFRLLSQRIADSVQARLDNQESLLEQTHGFFAGTDDVTADEFRRFSKEALKRFSMIRAIEWAPRVESSRRLQFEAQQQARIPGFQIKDRNSGNELHPALPRAVYYPITYIEPYPGNEAAMGFNILSTPNRAEALAKAIRTGRGVATPPLHLLQTPESPFGFLLLHAIKNSRSGDGIVLTIIQADQFMAKILPSDQELLHIRLIDTGTAQVVYNTFPSTSAPAIWQQKLIYGQREFLLATSPSPIYLDKHRGWQSAAVLAASILGISLLGAFLMLGTGYAARVEALVDEKIAELTESTEKLTGLYELSPLGIALADMDGRYLEFNESFRRITGYGEQELKQSDHLELTPEKYRQSDQLQLEQLRKQGRYGPYEKEYVRKDGQWVPVSLNALLIHGKNGEQFIWSIVEDISERKSVEEALRVSEERWKFALEGAGDGVWDWNLQTGEILFSRQEMTVIGYPGEEAQSITLAQWMLHQHPQDQALRQAAVQAHLSGQAPFYQCEYRVRTRDGRWKWILARGMLVSRTEDGQPLRMIGTHADIDERQRMQRKEAMRSNVMEMLARGVRLKEILDVLIAMLEAEDDELIYATFNHDEAGGYALAGTCLPLLWYPKQPEVAMPVHNVAGQDGVSATPVEGVELCRSELIVSDRDVVEGILVSFHKQVGGRSIADAELQQQAAKLIGVAIKHKRTEEQLLLANSVYMASSEAIMVVDAANRIVAVNPAFETITGYAATEVLGHDPKLMRSPQQTPDLYRDMWQAIVERGVWHGELWNQRKDGRSYPVNMHISSINDEDGLARRRIAIFTDITDKKIAEEQINHLAHYDLLTNLPNRVLYADRLSLSLAVARRNRSLVGLLYVDLDEFKPVNDSFGHAVGDVLLKQAAQRMLACVRESDTVARIGGDEFVVILPAVQSLQDVQQVAEKLRLALVNPFLIDEHCLNISASVGGAIYPGHGEDEEHLMQHADHAMYMAKKAGRNRVYIFGQSEPEA
ncbi:PAS domain S-box protein [Chitinibacter sp. GC72]|uniref:sensor domain-containing diguanylate cyclase n=1 Tax=Chitinibacter sp. GC72 TaxID=1526917 RepID=UPI0012F9EFEF|nr:PAS domain S-box protein [Chitinibacter sp. GC72]